MPKAQAPIVAPFSAGSPTPVAYNMPSPSTPSPAVYASAKAQPPAAMAPFQTLFGAPSPVVAAYSPMVSSFPVCHFSCSATYVTVCSCDSCTALLCPCCQVLMPFPRHDLCLGSTQAWATSAGLATPNRHASSEASLSATAERTTATNLRLCAANCTATSILHDATQPGSDDTGGLQQHSHCASLHRHCPHLCTTSCEGGCLHRHNVLCSCLPSLCHTLISNASLNQHESVLLGCISYPSPAATSSFAQVLPLVGRSTLYPKLH